MRAVKGMAIKPSTVLRRRRAISTNESTMRWRRVGDEHHDGEPAAAILLVEVLVGLQFPSGAAPSEFDAGGGRQASGCRP